MNETKTCTKCGVCKPVGEFHVHRGEKDGLQAHCKPCRAAFQTAYYVRNLEKMRARKADWNAKNPEKGRAWKTENIEKVRTARAARETRDVADLADRYVLNKLARGSGLPHSAFNDPALIDLKREQLTLQRLARELKQQLNNPKEIENE